MFASQISRPMARPTLRSVSLTALLAMTLLAGSGLTAHGQTAAAPDTATAPAAVATKAETVEDRIADLRNSLQITAAEEANWNAVAMAMRGNAAAMEKLAAQKAAKDPATLTAVDDLKNYELFAKAHVAGLKKLTTAFEKLYAAMPAAQKKLADGVFQRSGHDHAASHG